MIKRKELEGPSCLTNAADDEPIFVLKSTDELAPDIVREWASRYYDSKELQPGGITPKQIEKYREATALAEQMETWRKSGPQRAIGECERNGGHIFVDGPGDFGGAGDGRRCAKGCGAIEQY